MTIVDNRAEAAGNGLSGKRETWIITRRGVTTPEDFYRVVISEGITAYEAWSNASGVLFRVYREALSFSSVRVESPTAYHKRIAWDF